MTEKLLLMRAGLVILLTTLFLTGGKVGLVRPSAAAERVALVIGNAEYGGELSLRNPSNDADAMEAALSSLGFSVTKRKNQDLAHLEDALVTFRRSLGKGSLGLFFYAGHGMQVKGENFLVPVGAQMREEYEVRRQCLAVGQVLDAMGESESSLKVVILDCCRDNPFKRSWSRGGSGRGLASISQVPEGTVIAYSTSPDVSAEDGSGDNSPYTKNLVSVLRSRPAGGLELSEVFRDASRAVKQQTGQVPWLNLEASLDKYYLWRGDGAADQRTVLFDGKTLAGWHLRDPNGPNYWAVEDGELVCTPQPPRQFGKNLVTDQRFRDFDLQLDFFMEPASNSGVYLRGLYEVQLFDDNSQDVPPNERCGAIWKLVAPSEKAYLGSWTWNTLNVKLVGQRVSVTLNGTHVIESAELSRPTDDHETLKINAGEPGPIMLQCHPAGRTRFRNISIRRIGE